MRQLARGTLLGLTLGALAAALMLVVMSFTTRADCTGKSDTECTFEQQVTHETATWQRLGATGLGLLGAGGLFWLRTSSQEKRA